MSSNRNTTVVIFFFLRLSGRDNEALKPLEPLLRGFSNLTK